MGISWTTLVMREVVKCEPLAVTVHYMHPKHEIHLAIALEAALLFGLGHVYNHVYELRLFLTRRTYVRSSLLDSPIYMELAWPTSFGILM